MMPRFIYPFDDDSFAPVVLSARSKAKEINPGCALCAPFCAATKQQSNSSRFLIFPFSSVRLRFILDFFSWTPYGLPPLL